MLSHDLKKFFHILHINTWKQKKNHQIEENKEQDSRQILE